MNYYVVQILCVTVSPSSSFGDLFAPGALLRPPALVMLTRDAVKVCGTGNVVCKQWLPEP